MKSAHEGMGIAGDEFDALVADLVGALDKFKVGAADKDQLLGVLGPMRKDIVEKK
jgi:hemoglobin